MAFDEVRSVVAKLELGIASGPIVPTVTPHEIRGYLASRYDFRTPRALDEVGADVERMLRTWQVQVTHPRYFGLFNPSVTLASIIGDTLVAMYNPQLRSEEHTSELQSQSNLVCRLLLEKKKKITSPLRACCS